MRQDAASTIVLPQSGLVPFRKTVVLFRRRNRLLGMPVEISEMHDEHLIAICMHRLGRRASFHRWMLGGSAASTHNGNDRRDGKPCSVTGQLDNRWRT